uniref:uncharacterized protein LOC122585573 n=1 Tax=Erigeron canadensis TaxID=72917 RepID=UPI001CB8D241|nr:uncharacterized protein LOC122585573 [Erigeron canadensis]
MVFFGNKRMENREEEDNNIDRMRPPLHNFDLPRLKWGNQKLLRCMNVDDVYGDRKQSPESYGVGGAGGGDGFYVTGTRRRESELNRRFRSRDYKFSSPEKLNPVAGVTGDGEIEATREKLMFDFQTEVGKMKDAILKERLAVSPPETAVATGDGSPAEKVWNLRTRRAACKAPLNDVNGDGESFKPNSSSPVRIRPAVESTSGEKREREKFSFFLSRSDVEDDFMAMAGRRLPRKPKKRPRAELRRLDTLVPGIYLTEITPELYKVPDEAETRKR